MWVCSSDVLVVVVGSEGAEAGADDCSVDGAAVAVLMGSLVWIGIPCDMLTDVSLMDDMMYMGLKYRVNIRSKGVCCCCCW